MTDFLSSAMAMAMEMDMDIDVVAHLDPFSGYNSAASTATNTTDHDDHGCAWSAWSPVVDWTALTGGLDDFHGLIESMMDDNDNDTDEEEEVDDDEGGAAEDLNSNSTPSPETAAAGRAEVSNDGSTKGVRLVHLLMAAAEALGGGGESESRDLARVILVRLKELVSPTDGSNIERLAAHFSDALQSLLDCASAGGASYHKHGHHHSASLDHHQSDVVAAFQLLQDMSPYVKFGHFTANQAILESVIHDRRIHILDYDIMEGIQWAPLMQALASRKDGPPAPHLRITAVSRGASAAAACRRSIGTVQETGRRLSAFAASLGLPFSFHQCRLDSDESFRPSAVKLVKGEALIVNCMLSLPHFNHRSAESVASFLSGAKALGPRLIALAEEDVGATPPPPPPPSGGGDFVARFMDLLHQYSAVYDSLEAGFPMQGQARWLVERVFLGPRIAGSLGRIYRAARGGDASSFGWSWGEWLAAAGFRATPMSSANVCQAKLLLGLFNDGYRVEELASNRLVLGWKSRRLFAASIWSPSPPLPPSSSDSN